MQIYLQIHILQGNADKHWLSFYGCDMHNIMKKIFLKLIHMELHDVILYINIYRTCMGGEFTVRFRKSKKSQIQTLGSFSSRMSGSFLGGGVYYKNAKTSVQNVKKM